MIKGKLVACFAPRAEDKRDQRLIYVLLRVLKIDRIVRGKKFSDTELLPCLCEAQKTAPT